MLKDIIMMIPVEEHQHTDNARQHQQTPLASLAEHRKPLPNKELRPVSSLERNQLPRMARSLLLSMFAQQPPKRKHTPPAPKTPGATESLGDPPRFFCAHGINFRQSAVSVRAIAENFSKRHEKRSRNEPTAGQSTDGSRNHDAAKINSQPPVFPDALPVCSGDASQHIVWDPEHQFIHSGNSSECFRCSATLFSSTFVTIRGQSAAVSPQRRSGPQQKIISNENSVQRPAA